VYSLSTGQSSVSVIYLINLGPISSDTKTAISSSKFDVSCAPA
jgi:hypothetical protein